MEEAKSRWLRPNEIHAILCNHKHFTIYVRPVNLPPGGMMVLFDRKMLKNFRKDGHNWKKKKDGKTVKEAHEHLKRQAERVKRDKSQAKRGDDAEPQIKPEMVPVARFQGSRLASGHAPSPYQHTQSNNQRPSKVARLSSEATVGAALVEAENELGNEASENKEELKTKLKGILHDKSDAFNSENPEEDKV